MIYSRQREGYFDKMGKKWYLLGVICDSVCSVNKADASTKQETPRDQKNSPFLMKILLVGLGKEISLQLQCLWDKIV